MIEDSTPKNNVINLRRKLELNRSWSFSFQKHNQASNMKVKHEGNGYFLQMHQECLCYLKLEFGIWQNYLKESEGWLKVLNKVVVPMWNIKRIKQHTTKFVVNLPDSATTADHTKLTDHSSLQLQGGGTGVSNSPCWICQSGIASIFYKLLYFIIK